MNSRHERLVLIDALRGAAVLGILVDNIQEFSMPHAGFFFPISFGDSAGWNRVAWHVANMLFNGRFFSILMMVFGAAMLLGDPRSGTGHRIHGRRMAILALFGILHGWFLWDGDILFVMALAGVMIYPARRWSTRTLLWLSVIVGLGAPALMVASGAADLRRPMAESACFDAEWKPDAADTRSQIDVQRGSWGDRQALRVSRSIENYTFVLPVYLVWRVAALALLGMALFRLGVLTGSLNRVDYVRLFGMSAAVGLPLSITAVQASIMPAWEPHALFPLALAYEFVSVTAVTLAWISLFCLASRHRYGRSALTRLACVGRLSLSSYIAQTVICTFVFTGCGLGLFGHVSRIGLAGIVLAVWIIQLQTSAWWLRRFEYGPLEWVWRTATYGRRVPWMRSALP